MSLDTPNHIKAEADYIAGMKYREIAEKYNVSLDTVKSWKTRHKWSREKKVVRTKTEKLRTQTKKGAVKEENVADEVEQIISASDLTDKQRLFCAIYIRCFNATKAYQKAYGVDYSTASSIGYRLLGNDGVRSEIQRLKQNRLNREMLKEEDIFQKYMDIAFADITDFLEFGREEIPVMTMYGPLETKDEETGERVRVTKEVNTVRFLEHDEVDGTLISEVKQGRDGASIKLPDRLKALEWLASHMSMATEEQKLRFENIKAQTEKLNRENGAKDEEDGVIIENDV